MVSISTLGKLDCSMPPEVLKNFNAKKDEFQMMPESAAKALELVKDPSCELAIVANTIERDIKLSSSILTVANSPIYSPGRPITSVRDAIIHVGFKKCQTLIQACCAKSLMQSVAVDRVAGDLILLHCLATAAFTTSLNKNLGLGFQGEEFTAGLLHDLGRLLLGSLFPDQFKALHRVQMQSNAESLSQEHEIIGTDHTVMGCYFAIANRLPDELTQAIRFHHTPEEVPDCSLTAATAVASHMADHLEKGNNSPYDIASNPHLSAIQSSCGLEKRAQLQANCDQVFDVAGQILASFSNSR